MRTGERMVRAPRAVLLVAALAVAGCTVAPGAAQPSHSAHQPSGVVAASSSGFDVAAENRRAGSPGWLIPAGAPQGHLLEGYADAVSVVPGGTFGLHISATARSVTVKAIRIGWYGGAKGRIVWRSGAITTSSQSGPVTDPRTRATAAHWPRTTTLSTSGWPQGDYVLRLDGSDGAHSYVPITVRSQATRSRVVLMNSVMTWEAYNDWGGRSLYDGEGGGFGARSYAASFDRPYQLGGFGLFMTYEFAVVTTAERLGLPLAYETDVDVATRPGILNGANGLVSMGHDEYWTPEQRRAVEAARDSGTNLAFLGANVSYWRVRLAPSAAGPDRVVIGYKSSSADPVNGVTTTARFRDQPDPHPENLMTGQLYECFPAHGAFVVRTPDFFLFRGTGVQAGTSFAGLVGIEIDRPYPISSTPASEQVPALSPVTCHGTPTYSGFTYYTTSSGAGVVAVGTMNWVHALGGSLSGYGMTDSAKAFVTVVTENILRAMDRRGLAVAHPANPDLFSLGLPGRNTTGLTS